MPVVFDHTDYGIDYAGPDAEGELASDLASAIAAARGTDQPPQEKVGFGRT